jgi:hypothetical protein
MRGAWRQGILALPGIGVSVLPKFICPVCWPAYAGLLSSLGLSFLISTEYLLPLTTMFLALALMTLAFRATKRHGYGPFQLGLVAAIAILLGKFVWDSMPTVYGAVGLLILTSVWNAWPHGRTPSHTVRIHVQSSRVK